MGKPSSNRVAADLANHRSILKNSNTPARQAHGGQPSDPGDDRQRDREHDFVRTK